jgi:hypothetical protein
MSSMVSRCLSISLVAISRAFSRSCLFGFFFPLSTKSFMILSMWVSAMRSLLSALPLSQACLFAMTVATGIKSSYSWRILSSRRCLSNIL